MVISSMHSYRPIGRDFGDPVSANPAAPDTRDGGLEATRSPLALPDIAPSDLARAL